MNLLVSLPAVLGCLLLAAHFLRQGNHALVALCLAAPLLLLARRRWAVKVVQAVLLIGALLWIRTIIILIDRREESGQPWLRMAIILGTVALFTFVASLLLLRFRIRPAGSDTAAAASEPHTS